MATKKTTLMLDEGLYTEIKKRAAERGQSVSSVVCEALSVYLAPVVEKKEKKRIKLTSALPGTWIGPVDISSNSALFDLMDEGLSWEKLR